MAQTQTLPPWLKRPIPDLVAIEKVKSFCKQTQLHTVCEEARCPNLGECWQSGVATFLILGHICTRSCRFCAVQTGIPDGINWNESDEVASAVEGMNLNYVVVTSVTRDDLSDGGAEQFALTILKIKERCPQTKVEVLIPDFLGNEENLKTVVQAKADVISHNLETVERLSPVIRPQADFQRSLAVVRTLKKMNNGFFVKSGLMVGLGETDQEIYQTIESLYECGCDILTIGQYLRPTQTDRHVPVDRFVSPNSFDNFREFGLRLGFKNVISAPLVRSSFLAEEGYQTALFKN